MGPGWAALVGGLVSSSEPTSFDSDLARIEWTAPATCPSATEVDELAEQLIMRSDAPVSARATVSQSGALSRPGYALELRIDGVDRVRHWEAQDCRSLAELTALLVAIAADPVAVVASIPSAPGERRGTDTAASERHASPHAEAASPTPVPPRDAADRGWLGMIAAHAVAGVAQLPGLDAGLGVAIGVGRRHWRLELDARRLFERRTTIPGAGGVTARVGAWNTAVLGCGVLGKRRLGFAMCAGPELGAVTAVAVGVVPRPKTALWVAGVVGATLDVRLVERLSLRFGVQGVMALWRPQLVVLGQSEPGLVLGAGGLRASLGLATHFGPGRIRLPQRDQNRRSRGP